MKVTPARALALVLALACLGCGASSSLDADHVYTPLICPEDTADCDGRLSTGCETSTRSSVEHCGACGVACGAGELCLAGACAPAS